MGPYAMYLYEQLVQEQLDPQVQALLLPPQLQSPIMMIVVVVI
jgi:hypothetical protein